MFQRAKCFAMLFLASALAAAGQEDSLQLSRILNAYSNLYEARPGRSPIESLHFEGRQSQNGREYYLNIYKKRPDLLRYQLSSGSSSVVVGFDGETAWKQTRSLEADKVELLDGAAAELFRSEVRFESPLMDGLFDPRVSIRLVGAEEVEEEMADVLEVEGTESSRVRYFLSKRTAMLLKKELLGEDGEVLIEIYYRDYRDVEGFPFAFEVENQRDGETLAQTRFDRIRVNTGTLSFYFEVPD